MKSLEQINLLLLHRDKISHDFVKNRVFIQEKKNRSKKRYFRTLISLNNMSSKQAVSQLQQLRAQTFGTQRRFPCFHCKGTVPATVENVETTYVPKNNRDIYRAVGTCPECGSRLSSIVANLPAAATK